MNDGCALSVGPRPQRARPARLADGLGLESAPVTGVTCAPGAISRRPRWFPRSRTMRCEIRLHGGLFYHTGGTFEERSCKCPIRRRLGRSRFASASAACRIPNNWDIPGRISDMAAHDLEPELNQPVPRRARPREGGCAYGCALWPVRLFILPHTLAGPYLIFMALSRIVLCLGVWLAGSDVEGRIVRKMETPGKKGPHYSVEYVYTFDQADYTATVSMHADEWVASREGQMFNVRVLVPGPEGGHWPGVGNFSPLAD